MPLRTRDLRVENIRPLLPPAILLEELPVSETASQTVSRGREEVSKILWGDDDRLIVIVGPCSIHDPKAGMDYARRLRALADETAADLRLVMRVYFEKPRTTVGWKGLINDPHLDNSFAINEGLRLARRFLLDLAELGLPAGIVATRGNPDCHVILRGGVTGPNHDAISVQKTLSALRDAGMQARLMIDASHGNSEKDYKRQPSVVREVAAQVAQGEMGIAGMMMESFLLDGRQELRDPASLVYGQSITDACMGWEMTVPVLQELATAVRGRRRARK